MWTAGDYDTWLEPGRILLGYQNDTVMMWTAGKYDTWLGEIAGAWQDTGRMQVGYYNAGNYYTRLEEMVTTYDSWQVEISAARQGTGRILDCR